MLKTKTGEAVALLQLAPVQKERIEPVFHVGEKPPVNFVTRMVAAWQGRRCFLDGAFNFNIKGGSGDFDTMLTGLGNAGIQTLPVIEIGASTGYNQAAAAYIGRFAAGFMLKCTPGYLPAAPSWAQQMQQNTIDIDLVARFIQIAG
jgi:hypothetical protein